jgi:hypothetical protein
MKRLTASLSDPFKSGLSRIRSRAEGFATKRQNEAEDGAAVSLAWADQSLDLLEEWLLDEEQKQILRLNPWDVFLLYASAYLYVLGPASQTDPRKDGRPEDTANSVSYDRQIHGVILDNWERLGIPDASVATVIAGICRDAGQDPAAPDATSLEDLSVIDGSVVNNGLLSAAVRLAYLLNPKAPTTCDRVRGLLSPIAAISTEQYKNAFSVVGIGAHPYLAGTIQMKIQCRDPEVHRALKHHERVVQQTLRRINRNTSPCFLFSEVLFEIEADGYTPVDLRFSVDTSAALKLLTGNRLYSDSRVFLRELIQNAVDACNLKRRFEKNYDPSISLHFNDDISVVTVRDNGIGMDRQWIEKYFLTIGISLYQSSEVRSAGQRSRIDFNFISQFGIGFLSSFLVADKIVIKTRKSDGPGLMITISNLRDYFDVRSIDGEFAPGTEVSLHLKPSRINYCRSMEFAGYLKTNIRFLDVPVQLHDHARQIITVGREQLSYENPKTAEVDFIAPLAFRHSEGYLLLRAMKNMGRIYSVETAKGGVAVFQDGIFVDQTDSLLPEGARQSVIGRINLKGADKCALSMDRNRIFWTDNQKLNIKKIIRMGLADAANRLFEAACSQEVDPQTRQSLINNLSIFFDFNEVDDPLFQRLCEPIRKVVEKRFRNFVRIHFAHNIRTNNLAEAEGYGQKWQQRIIASL